MHLLQVYSNPRLGVVSPQELLFRSGQSARRDAKPCAPVTRARQLRAAETDELVRLYLEVRNVREVARQFRISRTTVTKLLAQRGVDTDRGMKPEDVAQAIELYSQGISSITIGKQLGFDNHTVIAALRAQNVPIRKALGR
ncbi:hypothetical protein EV140_0671 [Microcella alkaliphila]|uniref:Uncharacterized protein n=1 Tax=Microcella alkaliphila TaxID=279828 RepID=A0A4Q7TMT5_9MICO|nr:hypothetical protein EV140_0671 [Microcella alkaliphila]